MVEKVEWEKPSDGVASSHRRKVPWGCTWLVLIAAILAIGAIVATVFILIAVAGDLR